MHHPTLGERYRAKPVFLRRYTAVWKGSPPQGPISHSFSSAAATFIKHDLSPTVMPWPVFSWNVLSHEHPSVLIAT